MATPEKEHPRFDFRGVGEHRSSDEGTVVGHHDALHRQDTSVDSQALRDRLTVETARDPGSRFVDLHSPSQTREESSRLDDEVALMKAERLVSQANDEDVKNSVSLNRSRSRNPEPIDDFDAATNPIHERNAVYKPPEHPTTKLAKFFKYIHNSSWLVRYFTYIVPVVVILLVPVLVGRLLPAGQNANVGDVKLLWFGIWLEIVWLTLWAGRIAAKLIPWPLGLVSSLFTNNSKKWRDLGKALEIPATLFFWWLGVEVSFLPTMKNHTIDGDTTTRPWMGTMNKIIVAIFVGFCLNFGEKIIIQLIAISFHLRTYADRIEINKFQIGSLTKLYIHSKAQIAMEDAEFEEKPTNPPSGTRTPGIYADKAQDAINKAFAKVGDVAGTVAGDFTGKQVAKSGHPSQVVLTLLNSTTGSQVLARRLYRTFVREGFETVFSGDLKPAFDNEEEADAAFTMFDKDLNGDISMEELEAVCVEIGRERKSITASLKDLDSVVGKLDNVLLFLVAVITVLVLISLISTSAAGVLTSAGSAVLALSWLFAATAQEFLQSCVFVFVKHPFDVGDRVSIYGNTGATLQGDDYFVKEISLLYTEFKKMEGQIVQAPNSYLNTLFILNMRRSGGLAEAVPVVIRFGTTLEQIEGLRDQLLEFVTSEKREYQNKILTELREVKEVYSLTLNVIFFYKSNWQNELLRLQRRNKFICALMVAMQDLGIEGPRRNQAGWRTDVPMYMQLPPGAPPMYSVNGHDTTHGDPPGEPATSEFPSVSAGNENSSTAFPGLHSQPSILRTRASESRPRTESISRMAKRVDFSLGMKGATAGEELSDVYEDRTPSRFRNIMQEANMAEEERRVAERQRESQERRRAGSTAQSTGRTSLDHGHGHDPHMTGGLFRRGTSNSMRPREGSTSSAGTHRNRFLPRLGRTSIEIPRDSLAEEGQAGPIDPRTGRVSGQAVRDDSIGSIQRDPASLRPVSSRAQDFAVTTLSRTDSRKPQ